MINTVLKGRTRKGTMPHINTLSRKETILCTRMYLPTAN